MEESSPEIRLSRDLSKASSPLKRQLLVLAHISRLLRERGFPRPVLIGGCALAYYTREVYFTADIDLAYADREALDAVLRMLGFTAEGRYWVHRGFNILVEAPAASLVGEDAPRETVELDDDLECSVIGIEDLLIDRMNACAHWRSERECEMVELLVRLWSPEIDWNYLLERAGKPENGTRERFEKLKIMYET